MPTVFERLNIIESIVKNLQEQHIDGDTEDRGEYQKLLQIIVNVQSIRTNLVLFRQTLDDSE